MLNKQQSGCMVCGAALLYKDIDQQIACYYCGQSQTADAQCTEGHFVCNACHSTDALQVIEQICLGADDTDMIALFRRIRRHQAISVHGPEHHALVPAVMVTTYHNQKKTTDRTLRAAQITTAIKRGSVIPGGSCGRMGICGSASGVGTGFGVLLQSSPLKAKERQTLFMTTAKVLEALAETNAPRCCQRDSFIGLRTASELSETLLDTPLIASAPFACEQSLLSDKTKPHNKQCMGEGCPLYPSKDETT